MLSGLVHNLYSPGDAGSRTATNRGAQPSCWSQPRAPARVGTPLWPPPPHPHAGRAAPLFVGGLTARAGDAASSVGRVAAAEAAASRAGPDRARERPLAAADVRAELAYALDGLDEPAAQAILDRLFAVGTVEAALSTSFSRTSASWVRAGSARRSRSPRSTSRRACSRSPARPRARLGSRRRADRAAGVLAGRAARARAHCVRARAPLARLARRVLRQQHAARNDRGRGGAPGPTSGCPLGGDLRADPCLDATISRARAPLPRGARRRWSSRRRCGGARRAEPAWRRRRRGRAGHGSRRRLA